MYIGGAKGLIINNSLRFEIKDGGVTATLTDSGGHFETVKGGEGPVGGKFIPPDGKIEVTVLLDEDQKTSSIPERADLVEVSMQSGAVLTGRKMWRTSAVDMTDGKEIKVSFGGKDVRLV